MVSSAPQVGASRGEITPSDDNIHEVEATHPDQVVDFPSPSHTTLRRRKNKGVKTRREEDLVLGKDISILEAMYMAEKVLVGMVRGRNLAQNFLRIGWIIHGECF